MKTLPEKVAAAGAAYRAALAELADAAPKLFEGRQEGPENFLKLLAALSERTAWVDRRLASLGSNQPTATDAGIARRRAALKAAQEAGDEATVKALTDQLAALGAII